MHIAVGYTLLKQLIMKKLSMFFSCVTTYNNLPTSALYTMQCSFTAKKQRFYAVYISTGKSNPLFLGYIRYVPGITMAQEAHHFRHFRLARAEA